MSIKSKKSIKTGGDKTNSTRKSLKKKISAGGSGSNSIYDSLITSERSKSKSKSKRS